MVVRMKLISALKFLPRTQGEYCHIRWSILDKYSVFSRFVHGAVAGVDTLHGTNDRFILVHVVRECTVWIRKPYLLLFEINEMRNSQCFEGKIFFPSLS